MLYDYHLHSEFSDDSRAPMEAQIERGIALGLDEMCFTDHVDYGIKKDWTDAGEIGWRGALYPRLKARFGTTAFMFQEELKGRPELYSSCAVITDGRFSGTNNGCFVGHVSPEAADGDGAAPAHGLLSRPEGRASGAVLLRARA